MGESACKSRSYESQEWGREEDEEDDDDEEGKEEEPV